MILIVKIWFLRELRSNANTFKTKYHTGKVDLNETMEEYDDIGKN